MTISCAKTLPDEVGQWQASLALEFSQTQQGSRLSSIKRRGPLAVQKAFYPEGPNCAHVYLLHPPAGIVSGDELTLTTLVKPNAHALLTTPGANRFYRARNGDNEARNKQKQTITLTLAENAMLENLPLETLVYDGANGINTVDIKLTESSTYIGWDIVCMGLPASAQYFKSGQFTQLNRIYCDNKLIYHDRIKLSQQSGLLDQKQGVAGLAGYTTFATMTAYSANFIRPENNQIQAKLLTEIRDIIEQKQAEELVSVTCIDGLFVIRYLGNQSEQCKQIFTAIWQCLRPACCDKPTNSPRIWLT
ncbi:urease accessory protein UreD [Catenovulum maritimum]|uniref:Urease accessory protein UreD n=1 Tax=Catenovulum maritimum TaxID=1513271 RepID=A0A0J8GSV5_9ALTE|nr:urease accessory protein UreD [Catenovulum maritimum]KMT64369.1 hypothetical protein XM47_14820 [Catenovulum maritimum]